MAMEQQWLNELQEVKEKTLSYIQFWQDKKVDCKDPKKLERYQSKINMANTLFQTKLANIRTHLAQQKLMLQEPQENQNVKCAG